MRAPKFWYEPSSWKATFLLPFGHLYNVLTYLREKFGSNKKYNCLTICVGNLNVGGTGKTPTTLALADHFLKKGLNVHIVSRGYKGKFQGTSLVDLISFLTLVFCPPKKFILVSGFHFL